MIGKDKKTLTAGEALDYLIKNRKRNRVKSSKVDGIFAAASNGDELYRLLEEPTRVSLRDFLSWAPFTIYEPEEKRIGAVAYEQIHKKFSHLISKWMEIPD